MSELPIHVRAVLSALRCSGAGLGCLRELDDSQWDDLLRFSDAMHVTLAFSAASRGEGVPDWVRTRLERNVSDNSERFNRIKSAYSELAQALDAQGLEHIVLKGFSQWPGQIDPRSRMQSDMDLYLPRESVLAARDIAGSLGYEAVKGFEKKASDHLPIMIRRNGWQWNGNFFDPEMPLAVELHFQFWDKPLSRFGPDSLSCFWERRTRFEIDGFRFPTLDLADSLGYACLHMLRHLIRDAVLTHHVYELAQFLHANAGNSAFWERWRALHDDRLRTLEACCFRLAHAWFDCSLNPFALEEMERLPRSVQNWFQHFGTTPLLAAFRPNKDSLWLQVSLVEAAADKRAVIRERLMPMTRPPLEAAAIRDFSPDGRPRKRMLSGRSTKYVAYLASRVGYHAAIGPRTLWNGARWWWSSRNPGKAFWTFYAASFFFDFGMFIFFFLFNLFLLDRGFTEKFLGFITAAMAVGSIAGTIPAGLLAQRLGYRRTMLACFLLSSGVSALRALFTASAAQLFLAFLAGAALSIWAVCISPALAQLTTEENRPFGFSLVFASGIGIGVIGGIAGGTLPLWIARAQPAASPANLKQTALLISCAIAALALWPASRLRFGSVSAPGTKLFPRNPFLYRFLPAIAVWSLVTGALNPFFNVYFAHHLRMPVERVGVVFSTSQFCQMFAVLLAPLIFRRFGLVTGIVYTQLGTALALGCLAVLPGVSAAAGMYVGYMALQWMSEPGMYSLLMNQVSPAERTGASTLNFLVISVAQALAAAAAGTSLVTFGYPAVICATAGVAGIAALLFRVLLGEGAAGDPLGKRPLQGQVASIAGTNHQNEPT